MSTGVFVYAGSPLTKRGKSKLTRVLQLASACSCVRQAGRRAGGQAGQVVWNSPARSEVLCQGWVGGA